MSVPLWAFGLVLAVGAPFLVRVIADGLDARARKRTESLLHGSTGGGTSRAQPVDKPVR